MILNFNYFFEILSFHIGIDFTVTATTATDSWWKQKAEKHRLLELGMYDIINKELTSKSNTKEASKKEIKH